MLILEHEVFSKKKLHSIHVFQDALTGKWGYNDYLLELLNPAFLSDKDLAEFYITTHPVDSGHYVRWYLVDLMQIEAVYKLDWRATSRSIRIRDKTIIDEGRYKP